LIPFFLVTFLYFTFNNRQTKTRKKGINTIEGRERREKI